MKLVQELLREFVEGQEAAKQTVAAPEDLEDATEEATTTTYYYTTTTPSHFVRWRHEQVRPCWLQKKGNGTPRATDTTIFCGTVPGTTCR